MPKPKILLFDIETSFIILNAWALGQEIWDPKFIRRNWFILCWSAKWLGEKGIYHSSLPDFRGYKELPSKTEKNIDKRLTKELWNLLDECDLAIAHNAKGFDIKKCMTRFLIHGRPPPSPFHVVDTLSTSRSIFKFTSNKLGYVSKKLCVEEKMDSGGLALWDGCEAGDHLCWDKMVRYCDQDVRALEDVYLKQRPYMKNHPNLNIITEDESCPKCNSMDRVKNGFRYTNVGIYQKYKCKGCGGVLKGSLKKGKITNA